MKGNAMPYLLAFVSAFVGLLFLGPLGAVLGVFVWYVLRKK